MIQNHQAPAWDDVLPHLDRALDLEPEQLDAWLDALATTQPAIAQALRDLLAERAVLDAAGFLQQPQLPHALDLLPLLQEALLQAAQADANQPGGAASVLSARRLTAGGIIGPYRLIQQIGCGGMSSVWLAERCDGQPKRRVALKLPFIGMRMQVERFLRECDILAALTHPNIARLYDTGITDSGQPYLAWSMRQVQP